MCKLGREGLKASPDLLQIGIHIHKKAREEEVIYNQISCTTSMNKIVFQEEVKNFLSIKNTII